VILSYQGSPADTFTIEGGVYFGFLSENDSLSGKAVLHAGKIDTLDVTYGTKILLGETGFVLNSINGSVSGLADDAKGMTFEAGVTGSWGPEFHGHALLNIDDVSLAVDLLDKATVNGAVSILDKRLIAGTASLESSNIVTHDFRMAGAASLKIDLAAVQANLGFSDVMTSQHFTMIGEGSGTILGKTIGAVRGVASDKGMGAAGSYHLCAFHHCKNILLGYGMDWDWPPVPHWIGSDVDQFVTVSRAGAAASEERARVSAGQPLFVATAIGTSAAPELELVSPRGQVLNTRKKAAKLYVDRQPATNTTVAVVTAPQVGTWRVRPVSGGATRIMADGLDAVERVRVLSRLPHTSKARPLVRKRTRSLLVRWTSRNWPRRTRLTLYASPDGKTLGKAVKRRLPAVGHLGVPTKLLPKGASHLLLAVADAGRTVDLVPIARAPIWVR
jgi:hypothetical protein